MNFFMLVFRWKANNPQLSRKTFLILHLSAAVQSYLLMSRREKETERETKTQRKTERQTELMSYSKCIPHLRLNTGRPWRAIWLCEYKCLIHLCWFNVLLRISGAKLDKHDDISNCSFITYPSKKTSNMLFFGRCLIEY